MLRDVERPGHDPYHPGEIAEDGSGWMVTFSDLVLQLFAFVIVGLALERPTWTLPAPTVQPPAPVVADADARPRGPLRRPRVVESPLVAETIAPRPAAIALDTDDLP